MAIKRTAASLIEEFAGMGGRCALSLRNGDYYEGYILGVFPTYFEFGSGGPLAPEVPIKIRCEDVDFQSLSYFDENHYCYKDARWDEMAQQWKITPSVTTL